MPRWSLLVLLAVAILRGGLGTELLNPLGSAAYGWTGYAPLRLSSSGNGLYMPFDPTWLEWRPRLGAALLALGAGTTGAMLVALMKGRPAKQAS